MRDIIPISRARKFTVSNAFLDLKAMGLKRWQIHRLKRFFHISLTQAVDLVYWANRLHAEGIEGDDVRRVFLNLEQNCPWVNRVNTSENFQCQQEYLRTALRAIGAPPLNKTFGNSPEFVKFLRAVAEVLDWPNTLGWVKER